MIDEEEYKKRLEKARQLRNSIGVVSSSDNNTEITSNPNNYQSRLERAKNLRNSLGIYTSQELKDTTTNVIKTDNESNKTTTNTPTSITIEAENEANKPKEETKIQNPIYTMAQNGDFYKEPTKDEILDNKINTESNTIDYSKINYEQLIESPIISNQDPRLVIRRKNPAQYNSEDYQIATGMNKAVSKKTSEEINKKINEGNYLGAYIDTIGMNLIGGMEQTIFSLFNIITTSEAFLSRGIGGLAKLTGNYDLADKMDKKYNEAVSHGSYLRSIGNVFSNATEYIEDEGVQTAGQVSNVVGNILMSFGLGGAFGTSGSTIQGLNVAGDSSQEVLDENPNNILQAVGTGTTKGFASKKIEDLFDGNILTRGFNKSSLEKQTTKIISKLIKTKLGKELANNVVGIAEENIEEFLEDNVGYVIDALINNKELPSFEEWWNNTTKTGKITTLSTLALQLLGLGGESFRNKEAELASDIDFWAYETQKIIDKGGYALKYDTNNISNTTDMKTFYTTQFNQDGNIENINTTKGKEILNPNKKVNVIPVIIKNVDTNAYNIIDANTGVMLDSTPYSTLIQAEAEFASKMINLDEASIKGINEKITQSNIAINNKIREVITETKTKLVNMPENVQNDRTAILNNKTTNSGNTNSNVGQNNAIYDTYNNVNSNNVQNNSNNALNDIAKFVTQISDKSVYKNEEARKIFARVAQDIPNVNIIEQSGNTYINSLDKEGNVVYQQKIEKRPYIGKQVKNIVNNAIHNADLSNIDVSENVENDSVAILNNQTTNYSKVDEKTNIDTTNLNMEDRTNENVSDKNIKSYQEEHPEIKEEIQSMADMFLEDVANSTEGKRYKAGDKWTGQKRSTTKLLAQIKDETGATWNNITKALNDISKGNANYSLAKKIEIILDKALTEGYTNIYGKQIMPNDSYIAKRTEIEGKEPSTHKVSDFEFDENDRIFGEKIRGGNNNVRNENTRQKINRTEKRENSRREKESTRNDGTNQEKLSKGLQRFEEEQQVNLGKDFKVYKVEHSKLTDTEKIIQEEFSKITGLDYEIFSTNKNTSKNAFYYDNNLFVKHNSLMSKKTANFLPFHEFGHWLRKNNNKEWSKVKNIIENTMTIEQINRYKDIISDKSIFEGMNENQIREFVIEEIESDYIGNWANDIVNWKPYIESRLLSEQYVKLLIDITNENIDTHYNIFGSIEQQEQVYTEISSVIKNIIENKKIKDIVKYNSDGREIKDNNYIDFLVERYKDNKNISKVKTTTKTIQQILKNSDSRNETLKQLYKEIKNPTNIKLETQLKNSNGEFEKISLDIDITLTGLKESFNKGESIEKYSIIPYLDNLILTTQDGNGYFVMHDDKNRTDVRGYYYLFNTAMIDNKLYATKIDIKKTKAGDRFYVHRVKLINNEGASIQANNSLELEVPVGQEAPSIDNSIAQKNNSVKTVTTNNMQKEIKYSDRENVTDSQGRVLTKEQQEYFKDSKVRDENGNLLTVYHGTDSEFTIFDLEKGGKSNNGAKIGFWFTETKEGANNFANDIWYGDRKPNTKEVYLNIKKPKIYENVKNEELEQQYKNEAKQLEAQAKEIVNSYSWKNVDNYQITMTFNGFIRNYKYNSFNDVDPIKLATGRGISEEEAKKMLDDAKKYNEISKKAKQVENEYYKLHYGDAYEQFKIDLYEMAGQSAEEANTGGLGMALNNPQETVKKFRERLISEGYDGIVIKDTSFDSENFNGRNNQYVAFFPKQIKSVTNEKPTENPDIRYSNRIDTDKEGQGGFYSQLENVIEQKMPNISNSQQILNLLKNNGIKQDELDWTGIEDYINSKKLQKITKQEVLDYIKANQLQIEEVKKGYSKLIQLKAPIEEDIRNKKDEISKILNKYDIAHEGYDLTPIKPNGTFAGTIGDYMADSLKKLVNLEKFAQEERIEVKRNKAGKIVHTPVIIYGLIKEDGVLYNPFTLKDLDNDMQDLEYLYDGLHEAEMQLSFIEDEYGDYVDELELPKYKDYTLKYGENYQELLFTVPIQANNELKEYNSPHWDESNIIAHARTQDFEDITGNKVLFIEEIQSDMHQEGRKKEYFSFKEGENQKEKLKEDFIKLLDQENELRSRLHANLTNKETEEIKKQISDIQRLQEENLKENKQIGYKLNSTNNSWIDSQFPFKKNWHEFVLRRMINNAVLQGYNKVAWTTGEQQNKRYDLSKYVDKIKWTKKDDESMYWIRAYKWEKQYEEYNLVIDKEVKSEELESFLGKEIHNKIISSKERDGELVGSDLEVGGDGMKGFYDKIIPEYLNKYLKKWNSKVEIVYMGKDLKNTSEYKEHGLQGLIDIINNKNIPYITKQMGFTITEEMREYVKKQGQPLYSNRDLDKEQKSTPYDERVYKENIDYIKYLQDNNYLKNLMKLDNSLGQTNAQGSNRLIEQEIQNVDATGAWDNSIPVTKLTDIKTTIEEYLGKEIRRGHFRQRAYGIYKPDIDAIRVKEYKDIDNILHELGHALDVGKRMDIDKKAISEELLLAVKRHGGYENETKNVKLQEGFAEVIRMYGINPSKATTEYPKTIAILNEFRQKDGSFNDFMNKVQSQIYNYIHQNPKNRILSNQSIGEQTDKTPITKNKVKENIVKWVWDKDYLLKSAVNELSKANGKEAKLSQNAYILTRLAGGVNNKAISMISDGYIDLNGNRLMPGLNQLGELLNNDPQRFNDLRVLLVAQRDLEYKSKSLKTGLRTMDSKAVIEQFKNDYQIQQASQIVYDTLDGVLQYAVDNGLISEENAESLRESNAFYVPFQRVLDLDRGNQVGRSGSVAEIIRKRTGSELDIKDVLENIVVNSANIIQQVENNNVLRALYNQGAEAGIKNNLFQKIPTPMQKVGTETLSVWESELENQGVDTTNIDLEKTIDIFAPNNKIDSENLVTSFIDTNGKRVYLQFAKGTQDLFNSIMGLDRNTNSIFLKIMRKMNMPLRYGATMANVGFAIPNMISDTAQATIYSEAGFIPVVDNALGVLDILTATNKTVRNFIKQYYPGYVERINRLYSLYEQSGASNSTRLSQYRKTTQEIMKDIYGTKNSETLGIKESFKPLKRLLDIMTYIPEISESSTRFRVFEKNYEAYKNKGGSEIDARIKGAIESRDATQDFGRTGTLMHEINQLIPFSAARVGSSLTFAEKVKANPKITGARIAILTTIAMIIKGMGYDDDEIEELNQRKKNDNFIFKIGDSIITIKKPQGVMRSIINFAEYIQDLATGHIEEGKEGKKLVEWIENSIMDNMPADEIGGLIPNAISPLIENAVNKDFYYNTDIVKSYDLDLPEYMQYYDYTSQLAIWLGKIFNYSPAKIDNLISGYFGGLGTQVTDTIDYISGKLGLSAEKPAMGAEDDAIAKRFVVNINENSASIDEVYTRETELTKKKNGGTITSKEEEELERLTEAISIMATINKQIKEIKADLTTSGEEKAELIRPLQEQKTDTARQSLGKKIIYSENADKITSTKFYPSRSILSQNGYTLNLTEDMKKEYEDVAYSKYEQYSKQGLYSQEKLEQLESKCKDYAKQYLMKKYKSKIKRTK